jgi:hypothetical protein
MAYQAKTIRDMIGGLYDLVSIHGSEDDLTPAQRNTVRNLYREVDPYTKIELKFEEQKAHATR